MTEFAFTLPLGVPDAHGALHRPGVMRRATAMDEVEIANDPRARANESYLSILLLSRVITRLDDIAPITPSVIERLYAVDYAYLQELYVWLNDAGAHPIETACPACGHRFALDLLADRHEPNERDSEPVGAQ